MKKLPMSTLNMQGSRTVWQSGNGGEDAPELPVIICLDSSGLICLEQEGESIVIEEDTWNELFRTQNLLRKVREHEEKRKR